MEVWQRNSRRRRRGGGAAAAEARYLRHGGASGSGGRQRRFGGGSGFSDGGGGCGGRVGAATGAGRSACLHLPSSVLLPLPSAAPSRRKPSGGADPRQRGDLPKGTRIQLAGGEYVEAKLALEGRLRAQLDALADHRPLAYEARLSALYAIDPMSALSEARTVRQGATSIEERLRRDVLRASASAPEL